MPKILKVEGLWIPESLEEARQIIPGITEEQYRKWLEDGAVELLLESVCLPRRRPAAIISGKTLAPDLEEITPLRLVKLQVEVSVLLSDDEFKSESLSDEVWVPAHVFEEDKVEYLWDIIAKTTESLCRRYYIEEIELPARLDRYLELKEKKETVLTSRCFSAPEDVSLDKVRVRIVGEAEGWVLDPDESYILKLQYVRIPPDLLPTDVEARSSFHRCGWLLKVTNVDPGFEGHVYVMLSPQPGAPPLVIEKGARIVQMRLLKLSESLKGYSGQWKYR